MLERPARENQDARDISSRHKNNKSNGQYNGHCSIWNLMSHHSLSCVSIFFDKFTKTAARIGIMKSAWQSSYMFYQLSFKAHDCIKGSDVREQKRKSVKTVSGTYCKDNSFSIFINLLLPLVYMLILINKY